MTLLAQQQFSTVHVGKASLGDITAKLIYVCFTPASRHPLKRQTCRLVPIVDIKLAHLRPGNIQSIIS